MLDKKGMISVEAIIVFPITLVIMLILFSIITQEYKVAHKIISSNNMALEIMTDRVAVGEYKNTTGSIKENNLFFAKNISFEIPIRKAKTNLRYISGEDKIYNCEILKFNKGRVLVIKSALNNTIFNVEEGLYEDKDNQ